MINNNLRGYLVKSKYSQVRYIYKIMFFEFLEGVGGSTPETPLGAPPKRLLCRNVRAGVSIEHCFRAGAFACDLEKTLRDS